jgi:hypothetical protein
MQLCTNESNTDWYEDDCPQFNTIIINGIISITLKSLSFQIQINSKQIIVYINIIITIISQH